MKALVKTQAGAGNMILCDVPKPKLENSHSVVIKVAAAGICGSDISMWRGTHWTNPPVVLGHEFSGVVEEIGEDVQNVKVGDRVIAETGKQICGNCVYCNTGHSLLCDKRLSIGYGLDGAFAEYMVTRDAIVHKIPDNVSFDEAALCEPAANGVHVCCDRANMQPGDVVVVMGPGAIGLLCAQVAKSRGAVVAIVGIDADQKRLALAKKVGIDYAVNLQKDSLADLIEALTGGIGADTVIEASGAAPSVQNAFSVVKKGGTIVQVGLPHGEVPFSYLDLPMKEISLLGSFGHNWSCWERVLKLTSAGKLNLKDLVTHRFALEEWERAYAVAAGKDSLKVLLYPNGGESA